MVQVGRDSVWAFTSAQADSIIKTFIWNDELRAEDSLLHTKLDSCKRAFVLFHQSDSIQHQQLLLKEQAITDRDSLITVQKQDIKNKKKEINKLRLHRGLLGVLAVVEGVVILWILLK